MNPKDSSFFPRCAPHAHLRRRPRRPRRPPRPGRPGIAISPSQRGNRVHRQGVPAAGLLRGDLQRRRASGQSRRPGREESDDKQSVVGENRSFGAQGQVGASCAADGKVWTSSGVTAGLDMTLAFVQHV
ncbi:hypothetical protein CPC735_057080 [Coccidioides posadasii C735 delta SOWgp]|uniref:Uncharacterized protein n=1 Tax=Coccidioides posadasii (strain C735) TaxID=222929 RepID=C5PII5_COCP7|nr:hypothetical protein CPC735_057080 [Coccidioides posadasii C735 delta SOWgp]EER24338.1 hypothetical protein CPC735_057080 [Coccidioides posadasii C735 delta SOWgp]|eukprot:XP_003066483.1 hypothetical protein CPC735_057080 [Coccidioides posadasii C735 delta SOWgp]